MTEGAAQKFDLHEYRKWHAVFVYRNDPIDATDALGEALEEIERLQKVLRLAIAWLEADATVDQEIERELLDRDYIKSKGVYQEAEIAHAEFRRALEGSPE